MFRSVLFAFIAALTLAGCAGSQASKVPLHQSPDYYNYYQPSFSEYVSVSEQWLLNNRSFIQADKQKELSMNAPFELMPEQGANKAVLLVHGLADSPYSYSDLAPDLMRQGFHVQVLLLPGHGSKPSDMNKPSYQDWQNIVDYYADMLKQEYSEVWLGGFSTGANLVTTHAIENKGISGLMLFSPGFQSRAPVLERLAPIVSYFVDLEFDRPETNLARYSSGSLNGAIAYSDSAIQVRERIETNKLDIPVFIALSEHDSVIDSEAVLALFEEHFTNPANKLIWYGSLEGEHNKVQVQSMNVPAFKISNASHMSPLYKPCNAYYGLFGEKRMCGNGLSDEEHQWCQSGKEVWYSAWGYKEEGKVHARLTWNPHYQDMFEALNNVVNSTNLTKLN